MYIYIYIILQYTYDLMLEQWDQRCTWAVARLANLFVQVPEIIVVFAELIF